MTKRDILTQVEYILWRLHLTEKMMNDDFNEWMETVSEINLQTLMRHIEREQPVWEDDRPPEPIYGSTPSIRQHHTPISKGWESYVGSSEAGAEGELWNVSEHVQAVLTGQLVDAYGISPKNAPYLYFWWGDPLPWEPKDSYGEPGPRRRESMIRGENYGYFQTKSGKIIEYLAYDSSREANPFMGRAMGSAVSENMMTKNVQGAISSWLVHEFQSQGFEHIE